MAQTNRAAREMMNRISVTVRPWLRTRSPLDLDADVVDVWSASLVVESSEIENLQAALSADETARADRFVFEKDRNFFIVARGLLRTILSRYINMEPSRIRFRYGVLGKPSLAALEPTLRFNVSHSNGLALYAITRDREVGIDIEHIKKGYPALEIAERFFSAREIARLHAVSPAKRQELFFSYWTLKEAYVKAVGEGLGAALDQIDVSESLEGSAPLLRAGSDLREMPGWTLQNFIPRPDYIAALAVEL